MLLVLGIICMFYIRELRVWVLVKSDQVRVAMASTADQRPGSGFRAPQQMRCNNWKRQMMELVQPLHAPGVFLRQLNGRDWLYALVVLMAAAGVAYSRYGHAMDGYEQGILAGSALGLIALGWFWKSWQWYFPLSGALALGGLALYGDDLARGKTSFGLKFLLSSQSAIMWMFSVFSGHGGVLRLGLLRRSDFLNRVGSGLTWAATVLSPTGLFVRWGESYLIGADVGHIPVSNLYEVFCCSV